jgi:hypothetical protein
MSLRKIAQNVAQPIFVKKTFITFIVENIAQLLYLTFIKNCPK